MDDAEEDRKIAELNERAKPKSLIKVRLHETSIYDLLVCLNKMQDYDRVLSSIGVIICSNFAVENTVLEKLGKIYHEKFVKLLEIEENQHYSEDPEI